MKILYHHRIASKDGQYVHLQAIVQCLVADGHEVVLAGPAITRTPFGGTGGLASGLRSALPRWIHECAEAGYCALDLVRMLWLLALHRPDVVYERYNLFMPTGLLACRLFRKPLMLEVNAPLYEERRAHSGLSLHRLARWSQAVVWRGADRVYPVTEMLAGTLRAYGVRDERIRVIPNGVDPSLFRPRSRPADLAESLGIGGALVVGFVGFVREWHGLDRVVRALADDPADTWRFVVVGDGPDRARLESVADALGVRHRIVFTGVVGRDELPDHMALFDIAVQPDVVAYASPLKLLEYLACGLAIVAIDAPNIRELVCHDREALLFDPDAPDALGDTLRRVIRSEPLRERLSRAAAASIGINGYLWTGNARRIADDARALVRDELA